MSDVVTRSASPAPPSNSAELTATSTISPDYESCRHKKGQSKKNEEIKSKHRFKNFIPFYPHFNFGNKGLRSPEKDKKHKQRANTKVLQSESSSDSSDDEEEKKDEEKEEESYEGEFQYIQDQKAKLQREMHIDNMLYGNIPDEELLISGDVSRGADLNGSINVSRGAELNNSINDGDHHRHKCDAESKKYSLVKSRIAKYQKNSQRCNSPDCKTGDKSKTLDSINFSSSKKYATLDSVRPKYKSQVLNMSYEGMNFANRDCENMYSEHMADKEQKVYDELKLIYDGGDIYAVREQKQAPTYAAKAEEVITSRPHVSIDTITLISNKAMKASLNISVSGGADRRNPALPDSKWKESKFSRRSIRKSYKKKSDAKNAKLASSSPSTTTCSPNQSDLGYKSLSATKLMENSDSGRSTPINFPEYAKVNKKRNSNSEFGSRLENISPDCRRSAFRGCSDIGPVAKKIGQSVSRVRKDSELKAETIVRKTDSFKSNKVSRKGSFTCNPRPKVVKRPAVAQQDAGSFVKTQAVKLRRRDSKNNRKGEYRVSVTIQPSTVASLTNKFNSLISQNQILESESKANTEIPLGKFSVKDNKISRVYNSPRASFKRKYRSRTHRNKKSTTKLVTMNNNDLERASSPLVQDDSSAKPSSSQKKEHVIQKVPSIRQPLGDNKTDEEKVCDKIETALSSGKFKGETDESDEETEEKIDDSLLVCVASTNEETGVEERGIEDGTKETNIEADSNISVDQIDGCLPTTDNYIEERMVNRDFDNNDSLLENSVDKYVLSNESYTEDLERETRDANLSIVVSAHQKTESIDSGILSDENNLGTANEKLETVPEYQVRDIVSPTVISTSAHSESIDKDSLDTATHTKDSELNNVRPNAVINTGSNLSDNCSSVALLVVSSTSNSMPEIELKSNDYNSNINEYKEDDKNATGPVTPLIIDDTVSDTETSKPYSFIFKNTVRKTKERDMLKKECDRELKMASKDSWFRRNKSKDRSDCKKEDTALKTEDSMRESSRHDKVKEESDDTLPGTIDAHPKPKKNKENKIYETWIFKKLREKSQERKKFKGLTPVAVDVDKDADIDNRICEQSDSEAGRIESHLNASNSGNHHESNTTGASNVDSEEGYGKWTFKSRSRNTEKKKTKTSLDKNEDSLSVKASSTLTVSKEPLADKCGNSSPSSSIRTQHSRQMSDASSINTVDSESTNEKSSVTKLKATHSQRSNSSIPPPPKTPIPSPPKSARIIIKNINTEEKTSEDERDNSGVGSSENIYEHLYSPNLEKLKKNRAKLQERGIVPNNSFLWSDGMPPSTSTRKSVTPERPKQITKIVGIKSFSQPERTKRDTSSSRIEQVPSHDENLNYTELSHLSSDGSHTTAAYDEIGNISNFSYDDVRVSSCSYDDIRESSSVGYDSVKAPSSTGGYDPVNPPSAQSDSSQYDECAGGLANARLLMPKEADSVSYLYDDITYNSSQGSNSYEPVNPPDLPPPAATLGKAISCIQEVSEPENSPSLVFEDAPEEGKMHTSTVFEIELSHLLANI